MSAGPKIIEALRDPSGRSIARWTVFSRDGNYKVVFDGEGAVVSVKRKVNRGNGSYWKSIPPGALRLRLIIEARERSPHPSPAALRDTSAL